jgi:nitric oxide reductase large subunit
METTSPTSATIRYQPPWRAGHHLPDLKEAQALWASGVAIAGIIVGTVVAGLLLLIVCVLYVVHHQRRASHHASHERLYRWIRGGERVRRGFPLSFFRAQI